MNFLKKINLRQLLLLILSASTIIKIIYVFFLTEYHLYLVSDMGGYWDRALQLYNGDVTSINQWAIWPALYHYFLAGIFRVIDLFNFTNYRLEIVLLINIALSTFSAYVIFLIVKKITNKNSIGLIATTLYAFTFPLIYLNAFVLSENLTTPLTIFAIWFLIKSDKYRDIIISSLLLALTVGIRPVNGLFGLIFFLYILFRNKNLKENLLKGITFSILFFVVIGIVVLNNYNISGGRVTGLSANGGLNFFFAMAKPFGIKTRFDNYYYVIVPPINVDSPTQEYFETTVPIYNQSYFFGLGLKAIEDNPKVLLENIVKMDSLFFGPLLPSAPTAFAFDQLINIAKLFNYIVFIISGFIIFIKKDLLSKKNKLLLVLLPLLTFVTLYIFNLEQRYLYSFLFIIYISASIVIYSVIKNYRKYQNDLLIYIFIILAILFIYFILKLTVGSGYH